MSRWYDILRQVMREGGSSLEEQEKLIQNCIRIHREEKREKRKLEEKFMNEYEKKEKKEKTRELNELKKEKQQEWKESHKNEVKTYNKIYYEQNKEASHQTEKKGTIFSKQKINVNWVFFMYSF